MKIKSEGAITLVALIITIILMLILAGVVINLTIGDNGIFKIAKQAAKNYANAEANELADLKNIINTIDKAIDGETVKIDKKVLELKIGDYIKYNSGTNGEILCRVLYPASSEYGLQIISDKNVKDVILGSSTYSKAVESYNNAIETLNNEAEAYVNTEYAYDARCVGSFPISKNGIFIEKDNRASTYVTLDFTNASYIKSLDTDINYEIDKTQMETENANLWKTGQSYWVASCRAVPWTYGDSVGYSFFVRYVDETGALVDGPITGVNNKGNCNGYSGDFGLRPCISLKADIIKITGGDGKSTGSAYVIGK